MPSPISQLRSIQSEMEREQSNFEENLIFLQHEAERNEKRQKRELGQVVRQKFLFFFHQLIL